MLGDRDVLVAHSPEQLAHELFEPVRMHHVQPLAQGLALGVVVGLYGVQHSAAAAVFGLVEGGGVVSAPPIYDVGGALSVYQSSLH